MTPRRQPLEIGVSLLVSGVQLASAYLVLGLPDLAAARDFLTATAPSMEGSVAAATLLLWAALAAGLVVAVVAALTRTVDAARLAGRTALWSVVVLTTGLLVLAAGAGHRATAGSVGLSGGSLDEARSQLAQDR